MTDQHRTLPEAFLKSLRDLLGNEEAAALAQAIAETPPATAVRLNPLKPFARFGNSRHVDWCSNGLLLSARPKFTLMPALHAGCFYVQEPSSMIYESLVSPLFDMPVKALDLCAAPGGKSISILEALPEGSLLVANEYVAQRAAALKENLIKWGRTEKIVTSSHPRQLEALPGEFDLVAVDAPCSGEGMMRREQMAIDQWSEKLIAQCAATQREILPYAVGALREGGYLIYSTCTYNRRENEDNVRWLTENFPLEQVATPFEGRHGIHTALDSGMHALRFFPHLTPGEGLFVALMRKTGEERDGKRRRPAKIKAVKVPEWIKGEVPLTAFERISGKERRINVIPERWADDIIRISSALNCIYTGTEAAENKGRDMIPTHGSFLDAAFVREIYPELQLSEEAAADYLRCNTPLPQPDLPRGLCAAVCEGAVIGRANNLGTRINNLYPKEYRIRNL